MPPRPRLLTKGEVSRQLEDLPGWLATQRSLHARLSAPDFRAAVALIGDIADEAESADHHPELDLRYRSVLVQLSTHSAGGITQLDIELAHRISTCAARRGAAVRPGGAQVLEIAIDAVDADAIRPFWRAALGLSDRNGQLVDPAGTLPTLWFQPMDPPRTGRNRIHLDVYLPPVAAQQRVAQALAAGGRLVDNSFAPSWWVLADADGNEVCVCTSDEAPQR